MLENCGTSDAEDIEEYIAKGGYSGFERAPFEMTDEQISQEIIDSGLRGRGGGGFPAGQKWDGARRQQADKKYIVCNGDEGDPGAEDELKANAQKLVDTLESFGVRTRVLDISRGPSVTRYEVQPMAGVKISRITSLADDIALNLAVADVRMEAPIPGKPAVGIEVPNHKKTPVYIRSVFESQSFLRMTSPLGIALGKDIAGVAQVADLCKMPHLLIAGSTGSGKSVCVNSIIMSLLFRSSPEDVKLLLIDPKVVELAEYNGIPHLLMPVVTEPRKAAGALGGAVQEMERRYHLFAENNVRDIKSFNKLAATDPNLEKMPYIAIIIDELADLMMVVGKDVEDSICRIAQKARAAGMHLIVATQRPSVDVITGLIKANIPSRIAFAVSSQVDSRTILDGAGAEKLLGMGDMLFMPVGAPKPTRIQGTFVRDEEISRVLDFIKKSATVQYDEAMIEAMEKHAIQDGKKGSETDIAAFGDLLGATARRNVDNEIIVLKSRNLMTEVVRRLNLHVNYVVKHGLRTENLYRRSPIDVTFIDDNERQALAFELTPVDNEKFSLTKFVNRTSADSDKDKDSEIYDVEMTGRFNDTITTPCGLLVVTPTLYMSDDYFGDPISVSKQIVSSMASGYNKRIAIELVEKQAYAISISLDDIIPRRAEDVINTLIAAALEAGFPLAICDDEDKSVDFQWCRPWIIPHGWGCDSPESAAAT